ncbi:hypothetical protein H6504_01955 [Candidatus Woesearchaeota archaeon]|nr:hypothetical protein [Candidatus Woesearchaeota archaeon]
MKWLIILLLLVPSSFALTTDQIIDLSLMVHKAGGVDVTDMIVRYGIEDPIVGLGTHQIKIYDASGKLRYSHWYSVGYTAYERILANESSLPYNDTIYDHDKDEEGIIYSTHERNETMLLAKIPYSEEYSRLDLIADGEVIFTLDLDSLLCNSDNSCRGYENYLSCSDCGSGSVDGYCIAQADGFCDEDCVKKHDPDCDEGVLDFMNLKEEARSVNPVRIPVNPEPLPQRPKIIIPEGDDYHQSSPEHEVILDMDQPEEEDVQAKLKYIIPIGIALFFLVIMLVYMKNGSDR